MTEIVHIALAGNPNCGKTTLFNELTGSNGYVGNWPGVTVEKKQAPWRGNKNVVFVDLPGIYSLSPYSPEEVVSRDFLVDECPNAVINLVDATNLERSLYLTTQLLETSRPMIVGLNMCDLVESRGDVIDASQLSKLLGVPVFEVSALHGTNLDALVDAAVSAGAAAQTPPSPACFSPEVEEALQSIAKLLRGACDPELERWYAVKVFERDADVVAALGLEAEALEAAEKLIAAIEELRDDDAESIITSERYDWIATIVDSCVTKAPAVLTTSQKIDRIVTNRWLGIPVFVLVMFLVYFLSISTVGTAATDWVNEKLFADGFFLPGAAATQYDEDVEAWGEEHFGDQVDGFLAAAAAEGIDVTDIAAAIDAGDEEAAKAALAASGSPLTRVVATDVPVRDEDGNFVDSEGEAITALDADGAPVLLTGQELELIPKVTFDDFEVAIGGIFAEPDPADYAGFVPSIPTAVEAWLVSLGASDVVVSLVVEGVVGGVGAVLGFIPQMFVLFVLLAFLEDCGYMSRVAFVADRAFRRFGLSGKSFIPMMISTGCGVPGVMATKTIENERERRMTAMLTTMMPCGAKAPIIALVMGVLIGGSSAWWVAPFFYFLGIACIIISAVMLKKTRWFAGDPTPFVMELPDYHLPSLKSWWLHVWERVVAYVRKAASIIFLASVGIWFLSHFGVAGWEGGNGAFGFLDTMEDAPENFMDWSLLAAIGGALGWLFAPLGCNYWQATAASISALIAKENLVGTFGALYGLGDVTENSVNMWNGFAAMFTDGAGVLHVGAMLAFVAFNMLDAPCFAAIGTIRRQMDSPRWFWFAIAYQCAFGWVVGLIINQLWELVVLGHFGPWSVVAFVALGAIIFQLLRPSPRYKGSEADRVDDRLGQLAQ